VPSQPSQRNAPAGNRRNFSAAQARFGAGFNGFGQQLVPHHLFLITGFGHRRQGFHLDRFEIELLALLNLDVLALAGGTQQIARIGMIGMPALFTQQFGWDAAKVQLRALGNGVFTDHIPVKLDRVINSGRPFTNNDEQFDNPPGVLLPGVADGNFEDGFGHSKFVHSGQRTKRGKKSVAKKATVMVAKTRQKDE